MILSDLKNGSVFLDTNILLYAYTRTAYSPSCEVLLHQIQEGDLAGYVNPTVIDEFFHKILLTQVYMDHHLPPKEAIVYLKQNPGSVSNSIAPYQMTREVLENFRLKVLDTSDVLFDALNVSKEYGLLFSDALHAACARKNRIDYFITNDRDFDRVGFLNVIKP